MIHRFVDLLEIEEEGVPIVFLASEPSPNSYFVLWQAGNLTTPARMTSTIISSAFGANDYLADPQRSPDGATVVYCRVGHNASPVKNAIRIVNWDDTGNTELYNETGGQALSLEPQWKPDGTKIVFRGRGTGTYPTTVKHMDPDGSNVATLYTGTISLANQMFNPHYNYDGTKLAWNETLGGNIHVANADGSSHAVIHAPGNGQVAGIAWANTQNKIAFLEDGTDWKIINSDGTGLTTIATAAAGSWNVPIAYSWLPDDSAIVTTRRFLPATTNYVVTVATDGSGVTTLSPNRITVRFEDSRPAVFGDRIYYVDVAASPLTKLASVALDNSDYRLDFDGPSYSPDVTFHGFRGDTVNV